MAVELTLLRDESSEPSYPTKVTPEVQAERDRGRLALLQQEKTQYTDPESQAALNKEIAATVKKVGNAPASKPVTLTLVKPPPEAAKETKKDPGFFSELRESLSGLDMSNNMFWTWATILKERTTIRDEVQTSQAFKDEAKKREAETGKKQNYLSMSDWVDERVDAEYKKRRPTPPEEAQSIGQMLKGAADTAYNHPGMFAGELIKAAVEDLELLAAGFITDGAAWAGLIAKATAGISRATKAAQAIGQAVRVGAEAAAIQAPISATKEYAKSAEVNPEQVINESAVAGVSMAALHAAVKLGVKSATKDKPNLPTADIEQRAIDTIERKVSAGEDVERAYADVLQTMDLHEGEAKAIGRAIKAEGERNAPDQKGKEDQVRDGEGIRNGEGQEGVLREPEQGIDQGNAPKTSGEIILRESGQVDPRLLKAMAVVSAGATAGYLLGDKDPQDAIKGALVAGGALAAGKVLSKMADGLGVVYDRLLKDQRYRIDHLTEPYLANVASGQLANYRFTEAIKALVPDKKLREQVTHAIQADAIDTLPPEAQQAAKMLRRGFDELGERGQKAGILPDELLENYVTQLWVPGVRSNATLLENLKSAITESAQTSPGMSPRTRFAMERSIPNYKEGIARGFVPVTTDAADIFRVYADNVNRAIQNKRLIKALEADQTPGLEPTMVRDAPDVIQREIYRRQAIAADQMGLDEAAKQMLQEASVIRAPREYKSIDHPQMRGYKVHQDVYAPLKSLFDSREMGSVMRPLYAVSIAAKRGLFSFSLFHAKSLLDALLGTSPRGWKHVPHALETLKAGTAGDAVDQLVRGGLNVVERPLEANAAPFNNALKLIEQRYPMTVGVPAKAVRKIQETLDHFLWSVVHPSFKVAAALGEYEKALVKRPNVPREQLAKEVSAYVNDIFGGLDWYRISDGVQNQYGRNLALAIASPTGRRFMQVAMLAPDWTISTTRAMMKAIPGVSEKSIGDMHRGYVLRSALLYLTMAEGLNQYFSKHHVWENEDPTMVDLGDGRKLQLSKHFMEPVHWLTKPGQQALNKLGYVPKETGLQMFSKEYASIKGAPPMEPGVVGHVAHAIKALSPIPAQTAMKSLPEALSGAVGLPIIGRTEQQAVDEAVERALKLDKDPGKAERAQRNKYRKRRQEQEAREGQ